MKILTAKVVDGQLEIPKGVLEEGSVVTVLVPEEQQGFELAPEEESLLLEAIAQAERGEVVDGWDLLKELKG